MPVRDISVSSPANWAGSRKLSVKPLNPSDTFMEGYIPRKLQLRPNLWFPPQIVLALDVASMLTMQPIKLEMSPSPLQLTGPGVGF